jgi:ribosome biogenesis GTPase
MLNKGLIMRSTGSWYEVRAESGKVYRARLKGKFKLNGPKTSNPINVGDKVLFSMEDEANQTVLIEEISPRLNYIIRKSVHKTSHGQLLAANVDQAIFIFTYKFPKTSLGFLDRFLVTAEAFRIPVTIVFNKMDLLNEEEKDQVRYIIFNCLKKKCIIRYLRNPIFSPDAGGSINPKTLQIVIIKHGIMKLNEKNNVLLRK